MKRICICLFCIAILSMMGCIHGSQQKKSSILDADIFDDASFFDNTDLISTHLANGLTVLIKRDSRFPVVSTRLYVRAGSAVEPAEKAGISHLLEHMVFKGTEHRPKGALAAEIEAAGGYLNAATSFDYTVYLNDLPAKEWKLGVESVADMAFNAVLDEYELSSEKEVVIAELKRGKDNPRSVLFQSIQKYTLAETSYARPIIGFENTVRSVSAADMRAYIREHYQPGNMLLCIVGDVDSDAVLREVERIFSVYKNYGFREDSKVVSLASLLPSGATVNVERGLWNKAYFSLAIPIPGVRDVQSAALDMLASLLGGGETSFFVKKYKYDQKLVDSVTVNTMSFDRVGLFTVTAELDAAKVPAFWEQLIKDLSALTADVFTQSEMDRVCLNTEESLARARETVSGLASHLGYVHFIGGGDRSEFNYMQTMRAADKHMLDAVIKSYILPRRFCASLLVPQSDSEAISSETLKITLDRLWPRHEYIKKNNR